MTKWLAIPRRIGLAVLDLVLPVHCPACETIVSPSVGLCAPCFGQAHFIVDPCCDHCAAPFETEGYAGPARHCERCHENPPAWDRARAAFLYDEFSRRLILPLKYADRTENARTLGLHMARAGAPLLDRADVIIPVPLHRSRLRARRYNQAVLLARACLRGRDRPLLLPDALLRQRSTAPLAARSAIERRRELKGAIAVRPARARELAGRHVVLVDDVLTTGATATECAVALRAAGAASVCLLVAARTAPPRIARPPLSCT